MYMYAYAVTGMCFSENETDRQRERGREKNIRISIPSRHHASSHRYAHVRIAIQCTTPYPYLPRSDSNIACALEVLCLRDDRSWPSKETANVVHRERNYANTGKDHEEDPANDGGERDDVHWKRHAYLPVLYIPQHDKNDVTEYRSTMQKCAC